MTCRAVTISWLSAAVGLAAVGVARAQQGVVRLPFEGGSLQLQVVAGGVGDVEVVDGRPGEVVVADAEGGSSIALEGGVLSLTNRSAARVDYRISVPAAANVSLSVNGRPVLAMAAAGGGRQMVWRWPGPGSSVSTYSSVPTYTFRPPPVRRVVPTLRFNAYVGQAVVDSASISRPERIQILKVIAGGKHFVVSGDRTVRFGWHGPSRWGVVTPRADSAEVTIEVPASLPDFHIRIGDSVIWRMSEGVGRALCHPVTEVVRRDGRMLWSFTPDAGRLTCPERREDRRLDNVSALGPGSS